MWPKLVSSLQCDKNILHGAFVYLIFTHMEFSDTLSSINDTLKEMQIR